jgi:hypothetical protein
MKLLSHTILFSSYNYLSAAIIDEHQTILTIALPISCNSSSALAFVALPWCSIHECSAASSHEVKTQIA